MFFLVFHIINTNHKTIPNQKSHLPPLPKKVVPKMHAPPPVDENAPRKDLSMKEVLEVHRSMIEILACTLGEFQLLPRDVRHQFSPKLCEATAELMVSIGVEKTHECT